MRCTLADVHKEQVLSFVQSDQGTRNLIQRALDSREEYGFTEGQALTLAVLLLRGGEAHIDAVKKDYYEWVGQNGEPTWAKLDAWAATLDLEAGIAEPMVNLIANRCT